MKLLLSVYCYTVMFSVNVKLLLSVYCYTVMSTSTGDSKNPNKLHALRHAPNIENTDTKLICGIMFPLVTETV